MPLEITPINLSGVNCYLLKGAAGYVLVDTGYSNKRAALDKRLNEAGCRPGDLKLVILTHGDSDHADNAAYLREKYGAKIAVHAADAEMIERGDMSVGRKAKPDQMTLIFKILSRVTLIFVKPAKFQVFKPDLLIDESTDLSAYGLEAKVVCLPGHSKGSIGVLTGGGDLFCGDFIYNFMGFNMIDNMPDHLASAEKVRKLNVKRLHPGHGKPVSFERFCKKYK